MVPAFVMAGTGMALVGSPRGGRTGLRSDQHGSPQAYIDGLVPAVWVGAAVLAGALVALLVPGRGQASAATAGPAPAPAPAPA